MSTPTYRIEFGPGTGLTNQAWHRDYGRPTDTNLIAFVGSLEESTKPGGANEHLRQQLNVPTAQIVRQATDEVVARYQSAAFEVVNLPEFSRLPKRTNPFISDYSKMTIEQLADKWRRLAQERDKIAARQFRRSLSGEDFDRQGEVLDRIAAVEEIGAQLQKAR